MSEVRYSVNGKYFKDYGVYISSSDGLFDALKRKKVNTYDWAEYHGSSPDLSSPKFEQREISLKGFVSGTNWLDMKSKFDAIISEFQKAGTQRLLVEPFGLKPLPYEVCMIDDVNLNKTFKDGKMVGIFTLKLIEPNPLKIVLYTTESTLNLSYNSPQETEIFYGNGVKDVVSGNASLSGKTLTNRAVTGYNFEGRNHIENSIIAQQSNLYGFGQRKITKLESGGQYTFTVNGRCENVSSGKFLKAIIHNSDWSFFESIDIIENFNITKSKTFTSVSDNLVIEFYYYDNTSPREGFVVVNWCTLEKGNKATDWTPAPEDEKHIIIAGNVDEITNLTTNAQILWERL